MTWEKNAFLKMARLGAICFLPTGGGKYLMQKDDDGTFRPPGGGKEHVDKTLEDCVIRELHEEMGIQPATVKKKLKFIGFENRAKFWGNAVFELRNHGLKPGVFQASNDPKEIVKLVEIALDHPQYVGPQPHKLITEEARKIGDKLQREKDASCEEHCDFNCNAFGQYVKAHYPEVGGSDQFKDFVIQHNRAGRDSGELADISAAEIERLGKLWSKQAGVKVHERVIFSAKEGKCPHCGASEHMDTKVLGATGKNIQCGACGKKSNHTEWGVTKVADELPQPHRPNHDYTKVVDATVKSANGEGEEHHHWRTTYAECGCTGTCRCSAPKVKRTLPGLCPMCKSDPKEAALTQALRRGSCPKCGTPPDQRPHDKPPIRVRFDPKGEIKCGECGLVSPQDHWLAQEKHAAIAVDLDGTLAHHDGRPFDPEHIGEPVPRMLAKVKKFLKDGEEVVILTARATEEKNIPPIKAWLKKHGLEAIKRITNEKTPDIETLYDDIAVGIRRNTGKVKQAAVTPAGNEPETKPAEHPVSPSPATEQLETMSPVGDKKLIRGSAPAKTPNLAQGQDYTTERPVEQMTQFPKTGPEAIAFALQHLDLTAKEKEARDVIARRLKSKRPEAVKTLGFLQGFKRSGLTPQDLMIHNVPVIPPQFRPYTVAGDVFIPGDANELYRDAINLRDLYQPLREKLGEAGAASHKLRMYDAVKALYGYGEPTSPKTKERGVSGFLQKVTGTSPKFSFVHRKMLSRDQDFVGRGVIGVDPELGLDEIGIPEEMAWKLYSPYVQRRLVRSGMGPADAVRHITERHTLASRMLDAEMKERPVMYSRAPAWHKFSSLGGYPKRVPGHSIMVNPFVTTGMGADFDGDTCNIHLPSLHSAVDDVKTKLMPSKMLWSIKNRSVVPVPKQEAVLGLHNAQRRPARASHQFRTEQEALAAIVSGRVKMSDNIEIAA